MKYEYHSKFKIGDKVYYIGLELNQIVVIPCIVDSVCFTNLGTKYFVDDIGDEITEFELYDRNDVTAIFGRIEDLSEELVKREDKKEVISRIEDLSEELC